MVNPFAKEKVFKEAKGAIKNDSIPLTPLEDYRISPDDKLSFSLSTNNGSGIIERLSGISDNSIASVAFIEYLVRRDGTVDLPILGSVVIAGNTVKESEKLLTELYSAEYQQPFIQVKITNQRVIVFPGNGSDATVVILTNTNTTLMEALARAGGITDRGKANTVKLMRKVNGIREVYRMDLSTIEGLKYTDMIVQANDYIYVEPTPEISREIAQDIVPIISIVSSALFIFSAINLLK